MKKVDLKLRVYRRTLDMIVLLWNKTVLNEDQRKNVLVFVKEQEKKWEEAFKRFEAIEKTLIEHTKILEEHTKILQEHSKRLEELSRAVAQLHVTLGRLGGR